jgi:hypothetical protein
MSTLHSSYCCKLSKSNHGTEKHNNLIDKVQKITEAVFICCRYIAISQNTHYYGHNNKNRFSVLLQRSVSSCIHRTRNVWPRMTDKRGLGVWGGGERREKGSNYTFVCIPDWNFNTHIWEDYDQVYQSEYKPNHPVGKPSKKFIRRIIALFYSDTIVVDLVHEDSST